MKKVVVIYKCINLINGKRYIGSSNNFRQRIREHKRCSKEQKTGHYHLYLAINKYGWDNFKFEIIEECCGASFVRNERENYWIKFYNTLNRNFGYNMILADHSYMSEETRKRMSVSNKGKKHSEESKRKMSESRKGLLVGDKNPMFGKRVTEETRQKMSNSAKGKTHSEEHRRHQSEALKGEKSPNFGKSLSEETRKKISAAGIGRKHSEESKKRMSEAQKGEKGNNWGKTASEETRKKISAAGIGRKHSEESKKKMGDRQLGEKNHNFGKHNSEELKRRKSETMKIRWEEKRQLQRTENRKKYKSLFE